MRQQTSDQVAYCYQRAAENRALADSTDSNYKATYLDLEARWIKLALSYEFADRLNEYTAHVACALDHSAKQHSQVAG
jgi:hypothetical protein